MTVAKLIALLSNLPAMAKVSAWDDSTQQYEDVTDVVWADDGSQLFIETNDGVEP